MDNITRSIFKKLNPAESKPRSLPEKNSSGTFTSRPTATHASANKLPLIKLRDTLFFRLSLAVTMILAFSIVAINYSAFQFFKDQLIVEKSHHLKQQISAMSAMIADHLEAINNTIDSTIDQHETSSEQQLTALLKKLLQEESILRVDYIDQANVNQSTLSLTRTDQTVDLDTQNELRDLKPYRNIPISHTAASNTTQSFSISHFDLVPWKTGSLRPIVYAYFYIPRTELATLGLIAVTLDLERPLDQIRRGLPNSQKLALFKDRETLIEFIEREKILGEKNNNEALIFSHLSYLVKSTLNNEGSNSHIGFTSYPNFVSNLITETSNKRVRQNHLESDLEQSRGFVIISDYQKTTASSHQFWQSIAMVSLAIFLFCLYVIIYLMRVKTAGLNSLMRSAESSLENSLRAILPDKHQSESEFLADAFKKLQGKNEHLINLIDNLPIALITTDSTGTITSFNPAAEKLFGYKKERVINRSISMLTNENYVLYYEEYLRQHYGCGYRKLLEIRRELEGKKSTGEMFAIEVCASEFRVGSTQSFVGAIKDIPERCKDKLLLSQRAEEAAQQARWEKSLAFAMQLFNSSHDQQMIFDTILCHLDNQQNIDISAYYAVENETEQEDSGSGDNPSLKRLRLEAWYSIPSDSPQYIPFGSGIIGEAARTHEIITWRNRGPKIDRDVDVSPWNHNASWIAACPIIYRKTLLGVLIFCSSTQPEDYITTFLDRLRTQFAIGMNNLRQYDNLKRLADEITAKNEEITLKNVSLERADLMKSQFLANMSHELRTPLNSILGFSEILIDGIAGELQDKQTEYCNDINESAQHLLSLINDILDLSKVESGKVTLCVDKVEVKSILTNAITIIREKAHEKEIALEKDFDQTFPIIILDQKLLKQMIYNLLSNAVKFTPDGGTVTLGARITNDQRLRITVTDTGIGIEEKDISRIFKPFEQIDSSYGRNYEGAGLGLMLVQQFAELQGGTVTCSSEVGKGSQFIIDLPFQIEEKANTN